MNMPFNSGVKQNVLFSGLNHNFHCFHGTFFLSWLPTTTIVLKIIPLNQQYSSFGLENAVDITAAANKFTTTPPNLWQKSWDWKHEKCGSSVWSIEISGPLKILQ